MTRPDRAPKKKTPAQPSPESPSGAGGTDEDPEGVAWQINDPAPGDSTTDDDDARHRRPGGKNPGKVWQINEHTKE